MDARWGRLWFATAALAVAARIVIQLFVTVPNESSFGGSPLGRGLNVFAFFTIQSNVIVGVTCLLLALDATRTSTVFATFRLIGVVAIAVTFLVFHVALSRLLDLDTWPQIANQLQHNPYPFADNALGYLRVTIKGIWIALHPSRACLVKCR